MKALMAALHSFQLASLQRRSGRYVEVGERATIRSSTYILEGRARLNVFKDPPFSVLKLRHFGRLVYFEIEIIQKRLDRHVTSNLIRFLPAAEFGQINGKRSGLRRKRLRRHKLPRKIPRQKCSLNDVDRGGVHAILNDHSDDAAFGDDRAPDVPSLTLRPSDTIVPMGAIFVTRP